MNSPWSTALDAMAARLSAAGIDPDDARLEVRWLLEDVLGISPERSRLRTEALSESEERTLEPLLARRVRREPFSYITGSRWFHGLEFNVDSRVLIPRPETEMIVDFALETVGSLTAPRIADVGTGSGCIAVAIAVRQPGATVDATDVRKDALDVARANAHRHGVSDRITFHCGDLLAALPTDARYDILVSNPPYIPLSEITELQPEVAIHEPHTALVGQDDDGLGCYRRLAAGAADHMAPGGQIAVEVGAGQATRVGDLFEQARWGQVRRLPDLAGIERVVVAVAPK